MSYAGHVDEIRKLIDNNNSTITHQNLSKFFRQNVLHELFRIIHGYVQHVSKVDLRLQGPEGLALSM